MTRRFALPLLAACLLATSPAAADSAATPAPAAEAIVSSVNPSALPKHKRTPLGLYLTPEEAHQALKRDPEILFVDVRDPVELSYVGHPEGMDANVPLALVSRAFDQKGGRYKMTANPDFAAQVEAARKRAGLSKDAPVFVICRSGARSARAAQILAQAGYTQVWNLVEGFEGDRDKASGQRTVNGWRNAGLPWGYKIAPEAAWRPSE